MGQYLPLEVVVGETDRLSESPSARLRPSLPCPVPWRGAAATSGPSSLDDLIRPRQQRLRDRKAKRFGGLEVHD
jgi:hypothetical protein